LSDNTNLLGGDDPNAAVPSSFQTQMAMAMMKEGRGTRAGDSADRDRMGRLVLARMKTLEESIADVVKEMRELKSSATAPPTRRNSSGEVSSSGLLPTIEVAGRDRSRRAKGVRGQLSKKVSVRRPTSQRSMKDFTKLTAMTTSSPQDIKGKGKEVVGQDEDEEAYAEDSFMKKGSSL
jgi:hypothetical protein